MKYFLSTFSKLSLAMLAIAGMVFFVLPNDQQVKAQTGTRVSVCFLPDTKTFSVPATGGGCPTGSDIVSASRNKGFCVFSVSGKNTARAIEDNPEWSLNATGTKCESVDAQTNKKVPFADYKSMASITSTTTPGGGTNTPTNTGGTTKPPVRGGCDEGFHESGPLCVPDSPFTNNGAITGETTAGGLAARIVKILLYFAGIVAVVMSIIGGYQVMTAAGNETQATNGRKTLINAIIGLVIIILSYIIINAVISFITT